MVASLAELRAIEHERVAADRAAILDAEQARAREHAQAAQRLRDGEAARVSAEREAALQLVREREQSERAARMHVEATEAAERARHQAALDAHRLTQELELRRAEIAKKRPTWMVALTLVAVVAAGALTWFTVDSLDRSTRAVEAQRAAEQDKAKAIEDAKESARQLAGLEQELRALDQRVTKALDDVMSATDAAASLRAKIEFDQLKAAQADLERRRAEAKARALHDQRVKPVHISDECKQNALAKDCR